MTPEQISLVQTSFLKIEPISDIAAGLFYSRLFALDPNLKSLFKGEMKEQGRKLMDMLKIAVNGLNRLDEIVPAVQKLGVRHAGYGVTEAQYDTVGTALLWTLAYGLGDDFTDDTRQAWTDAYTVLANTMKAAAASDGPVV